VRGSKLLVSERRSIIQQSSHTRCCLRCVCRALAQQFFLSLVGDPPFKDASPLACEYHFFMHVECMTAAVFTVTSRRASDRDARAPQAPRPRPSWLACLTTLPQSLRRGLTSHSISWIRACLRLYIYGGSSCWFGSVTYGRRCRPQLSRAYTSCWASEVGDRMRMPVLGRLHAH
jgi:hypothetical protein